MKLSPVSPGFLSWFIQKSVNHPPFFSSLTPQPYPPSNKASSSIYPITQLPLTPVHFSPSSWPSIWFRTQSGFYHLAPAYFSVVTPGFHMLMVYTPAIPNFLQSLELALMLFPWLRVVKVMFN